MSAQKVFLSLVVVCALATFAVSIILVGQQFNQKETREKLQVIVDTDIGPWADDVGVFSMLHTFADAGELDLVAVMANNAYEGVVPVVDALNAYFNRSHIPIGITRDETAHSYSGKLGWPEWLLEHAEEYPHPNYQNNSQAEDAVVLYRRLLSAAADRSITILSIGYLTNLGNLLQSTGDQYSNLSGVELVQVKVKRMVAMAGWFPSGTETNLKNQTEPARIALPHWPTPIDFVGFEVGRQIHCGGNLIDYNTNSSILPSSPVSKIFEMFWKSQGFIDGCFDQTAAYVMVKGLSPFYTRVYGQIEIFPNGTNVWNDNGTQAYIRQQEGVSNVTIVAAINPLLDR